MTSAVRIDWTALSRCLWWPTVSHILHVYCHHTDVTFDFWSI